MAQVEERVRMKICQCLSTGYFKKILTHFTIELNSKFLSYRNGTNFWRKLSKIWRKWASMPLLSYLPFRKVLDGLVDLNGTTTSAILSLLPCSMQCLLCNQLEDLSRLERPANLKGHHSALSTEHHRHVFTFI